ncbi:hypothetical protein [Rhizobium sp. AP16]|uniref:hypothetical protein n=1 Tax=Rhizobium sp. AP16 TaxID=1144306 RepID=UPI00026ED23B|nr:hypothetical protein [Rhizobium sp. AP16]EJK83520.1 hypothetical protein PMI03_03175 [Rhizobium sp. AP16]
MKLPKIPRKRKAEFSTTLIYADEPQLILLRDRKVPIVAIAVPDDNPTKMMFLAVSVPQRDWQAYMDGNCDLRYLYTYRSDRLFYLFDLLSMVDNQISMQPFTEPLPERYLPEARLFSTYHTEEIAVEPLASDEEVLVVDGEWDMPEFGNFYQRYTDVYAFIAALKNWKNAGLATTARASIGKTFREKPFQGGFSYVHFFQELTEKLQRTQRIGLEKISYASPGTVEIRGEDELFTEMQAIIPNFLSSRPDISRQYNSIYKYLSENKYLKQSVETYIHIDAVDDFINAEVKKLSVLMTAPDFDTVAQLTDHHPLATAKVIMSFYRRLDDASAYFAQGRVSFTD